MGEPQEFDGKLGAFLGNHERILVEFTRSVASARHFLQLADRSIEQEPEETVLMLEQIRDIGLREHLASQYEEFRSVAGLLRQAAPAIEAGSELPDATTQLALLEDRYESLVAEVEDQMEVLERMLFSVQNQV